MMKSDEQGLSDGMPLPFSSNGPYGAFTIGFSRTPRYDFGVFAKGYHSAARVLSDALLAKPHFADYEAYPVVFLYRHALELALKNIIYKGALLSGFRRMKDIDSGLYNQHGLDPIARKARSILVTLFPRDSDLRAVADHMVVLAQEVSKVDSTSHTYRYPIRADGSPTVDRQQTLNLGELSARLSGLLDQMDVIDFGLDLDAAVAQEVYEIVESVKTEEKDCP